MPRARQKPRVRQLIPALQNIENLQGEENRVRVERAACEIESDSKRTASKDQSPCRCWRASGQSYCRIATLKEARNLKEQEKQLRIERAASKLDRRASAQLASSITYLQVTGDAGA